MTNATGADSAASTRDLMHELERGLTARIEELERETRRVRSFNQALVVAVAVLLGIGAALVVFGRKYGLAGTGATIVEAREFRVRDAGGTIRGAWAAENDGTVRLAIQNGAGRGGLQLSVLPSGAPGVSFIDSAGRTRAVLGLLPDETVTLTFADRSGRTRTVLGLASDGGSTLVFADRSGETRAGLGVDSRGNGTFTMVDRVGQVPSEPDQADGVTDSTETTSDASTAPRRR